MKMDAIKELITQRPAELAVLVLATAVLGAIIALSPALYKAMSTKRSPELDAEKFFTTEKKETKPFPSIAEDATLTLSVVVPAYNEEKRIGRMLDEMLAVLQGMSKSDSKFKYEIVIVDDGSKKDDTSGYVIRNYVQKYGSDTIRLCKLVKNVGKGGAVRKGALRCRGAYILMADADGATDAKETSQVLQELKKIEKEGLGMAIGSRAHLSSGDEDGPKAKRSAFRRLLMWGFKTLLSLLVGGLGVKDTQCGFKMFTRASARAIFPAQHIERWAFDIELLYLGVAVHRMPCVEVPVAWEEVDGSKVDIFADSLQMARDVAAIRLAYMLGIWRSDDASLPAWRSTDKAPSQ